MNGQQQFWNWFIENENELFNFEANQEGVFDKLAEQLQRFDPDLSFEVSNENMGKRELVISASGIKRAFSAVQNLVAAAPNLERWQITSFRPRRFPINVTEFRGRRVQPNDVQFSLLHNGKTIGIYLFIPGYSDGDADIKQIGYLLLDEALGEFDVESKVGLIKMYSPQDDVSGKRYPLQELPDRFDELRRQLNPQ